MGLILSEPLTAASERRMVAAAAAQAERLADDGAELPQHALLVHECFTALYFGKPATRIDVPGWRDAYARRQGPALITEVVSELLAGDGAMADLLAVLGKAAQAGDPHVTALLKRWAVRHANFHATGVAS